MADIAAPYDPVVPPPADLDPLTALPDGEEVVCDLDAQPRPSDRPTPFWFRHAGRRWMLLDQVFADWQELAAAQGNPRAMMHALLPAEQRLGLLGLRMEVWQLENLMSAYRTHYQLIADDDGATGR